MMVIRQGTELIRIWSALGTLLVILRFRRVESLNSLRGRPTLIWKQVGYCADASRSEPGLVISCFVIHPLSPPHSHAILLHFPVPAGNRTPVKFYEPSCARCSQDGTHFAFLCGLQRGSRPEDRRVPGVGRTASRQRQTQLVVFLVHARFCYLKRWPSRAFCRLLSCIALDLHTPRRSPRLRPWTRPDFQSCIGQLFAAHGDRCFIPSLKSN